MDDSRPQGEFAAYAAFLKLMETAQGVRKLFEDADAQIPEPLVRFLGLNGKAPATSPRAKTPGFIPSSKPPGFADGWIWVDCNSLIVTTLVLTILRQFKRPVSPQELFTECSKYQPATNQNSVFNVGARLASSLIDRTKDGWVIKDESKAPILHAGLAWGPIGVFDRRESSTFRRELVLHILRGEPGGMKAVKIGERFRSMELYRSPYSKDLLKFDLETLLASKKVHRVGKPRKWKVANE